MSFTQSVISSATPTRTPANEPLSVLQQQQTGTKESLYQLPVQRKLSVGAADDPLEKEADDMADKVMRMPNPEPISFLTSKNVINRKCSECEKEEELQRKESNSETLCDKVMRMPNPEPINFSTSKNVINRKCSECEKEEELHRKESNSETVSAPPIVQDVLSSPGRSLDTDSRSFMEPRFNYDFKDVKIHDSDLAAESANSINALAYTSGNNIVFNSGQYNATSDSGKRLLAHELTHVVQQNGSVNTKTIQRWDWGRAGIGGLIGAGAGAGIGALIGGVIGGGIGAGIGAAIGGFLGLIGGGLIGGLTGEKKCNINYAPGKMDEKARTQFLTKNFAEADRPAATKILNDLCAVENDKLNFSSEEELKSEIQKRMLIGKYMQESQTNNAFDYPENAKPNNCTGAIGDALRDARVNLAARDYWEGPIIETRSQIQNKHYYFKLSATGKNDAYNAIKLLFTPQTDICNRTLIHCDTLITLVNILVYAETIGIPVFNVKVKNGLLGIWLTYDGLSAIENDTTPTAASSSLRWVIPSNEDDLVIGDHVVFWNHQAYDAISFKNPGPWRLENAVLVDKAANGDDLFEGHGAPQIGGVTQPGTKKDIHTELMNVYNNYAKEAADLAGKTDDADVVASIRLRANYPYVFKNPDDHKWYIKELERNNDRPRQKYELREIKDPLDPEIIGLKNPYNTSQMSSVKRPVESL